MQSLKKLIDNYKRHSQLKKNVVSGTVASVSDTLITMISYPIYIRYLGIERYGLWTIISVVFSFSQFGQMGMERALMKYVSSGYGKRNYQEITEYISTSFYILSVLSLFIILIVAFFKTQLADIFKLQEVFRDDGVRLIFYVGLLSVFSFFVNAVKGVVVGIGRMDIANYYIFIGRALQILLNVFLLVLGFGIWSLYYGFVIYYVCPLILWVIILSRTYNISIFNPLAFDRQKMKELLKFGGTLVIGMIAQMLVTPFNKVIIGRYVGLAEVAYYQIATQVVTSAKSLFARGLESIFPKVSELYGNNLESLKAVFSVRDKGMKLIYFFAVPLFISIFIFAEIFLKLWLGGAFNIQIVVALRILLMGWLMHSLVLPDGFMLLGVGKVGYIIKATCLRSVTNVIFIYLLIFQNINISFNKVVMIDSMSLITEVMLIKYFSYKFKKTCEISLA